MDKIPLHLLNAFIVFNESKNISEAAVQLQITQPALSKQLKLFEEMLPSSVFTQSGRKKTLTVFGRDLHHRLKNKIGNIQQLVEQTWSQHANPTQATIKLAARRGVLDRISAKIKFAGTIFFEELANEAIIESLLRLDSEIGVVHKIPETHELTAKPLFKEEFHLVIPKSLLKSRPVLGDDLFLQLKLLPCLGYRPDDENIKSACSFDSMDMRTLKMVRATENYFSISEMVDAKLGWTVMPTYIKVSETKNWIVPIPAKVFASRQFYIVYRPEFAAVPWFKDLITEIRTCFS